MLLIGHGQVLRGTRGKNAYLRWIQQHEEEARAHGQDVVLARGTLSNLINFKGAAHEGY